MSNYKEIVTKAIIGKAKKTSSNTYEMSTNEVPDTILGCWVINHNFQGYSNNNNININGSFDVNVWYSYDNNTKTGVSTNNYTYNESLKVNLKEDSNNNEVIVRSLKQPTVTDVKLDNGIIKMNIEKELGVEVVGNTKIKVPIEDLVDDYEDVSETVTEDDIENVDTEYLK